MLLNLLTGFVKQINILNDVIGSRGMQGFIAGKHIIYGTISRE